MLFSISNIFAQEQKTAAKKEADPKISEVILVTEMHCANCAEKVKKQLAYTKGVIDVQADHTKNAVYVKFRNDRTDNNKLIASLKEIGYEAKVFTPGCGGCPHHQNGGCSGHHEQNNAQAQPAHQCSGEHKDGDHHCSGDHQNCQGHKDATKK